MAKPILIKPNNELSKKIREVAKQEGRKPGPMVLLLLNRYFAKPKRIRKPRASRPAQQEPPTSAPERRAVDEADLGATL